MTSEAFPRPGFSAVLVLVVLGCAAFLAPWLWHPPGLVEYVDAPAVAVATGAAPSEAPGADRFAPLADASYRLDGLFSPGAADLPWVMRAQSLLLHLLASLALLALMARLGVGRLGAAVGACLFLCHPSLLESVVLPGLRPAVLAGLLVFTACFCVARAGGATRRVGFTLVAALAAGAAVAALPGAIVAPLLGYLVGIRVAGRGVAPAIALAIPVALAAWCGGADAAAWRAPGRGLPALADPLAALVWPRTPALLAEPAIGGLAGAVLGCAGVLASAGAAFWLRVRQPSLAVGFGVITVGTLLGPRCGPGDADLATYLTVGGAAVCFAALRLAGPVKLALGVALIVVMLVTDWRRAGFYRDGPSLWQKATASPLAQTLLGEHLARSPMDESRRAALEKLKASLPHLPAGRDAIRGRRTLIRLLGQMGFRGEASAAAERLAALADRLGGRAVRLDSYLLAAECFSAERHDEQVDAYMAKARGLAPAHPEVIAAAAERRFGKLVEAVAKSDRPGWLKAGDERVAPIEAAVSRALAVDPDCYRALVLQGRLAVAQGRVLDAMPSFEKAVAARPERIGPRLLLAKLFVESDMIEDAEKCVRKALHDGVDDPRLHYWLALFLTKQGRAADARQHLEAYVRNRGASHQARMLLANLLSAEALRVEHQVERSELARRAERIKELNPDDPKGYLVQAAVLLKPKDGDRRKTASYDAYRRAIALLELARARMPEDVETRTRLAKVHRAVGWRLKLSGATDRAMAHFRECLAIAPESMSTGMVRRVFAKHCKTLHEEGHTQLRDGDAERAETALRKLTELLPERADGYFLLGLARLRQKKLEPALRSFETAVKLGREDREDISFYMLPLLDTLKLLGQGDEARRRGLAFLERPGRADAETLAKIKALVH